MSSVKIIKNQIWEREQCCFFSFQNLFNLSFILSLCNKVFRIENFHSCSVCSWLHQKKNFEFFETLKFEFFDV
jgi:hypothetical protein